MYISTCLPGVLSPALVHQLAAAGFTHVDLVARIDRPQEDLELLADTGLIVSCAALGKELPEDHHLAHASVAVRRRTLEIMKRQVSDAVLLGASQGYLVPPREADADGLARFAEGCCLLADFAAPCRLRLCIEHFPGRILPSAAAVLSWLEQTSRPDLSLLLDVGHCLISSEEPLQVIGQAGPCLGYVHLNDNDGHQDLHWPLLAGRLTEPTVALVLESLLQAGYDRGLALEFDPAGPNLMEALEQGKGLLERLLAETGASGQGTKNG